MSRFLDGPVSGSELSHGRAPIFLRVVRDRASGKVDVLDRLYDIPEPSEDLFVYRAVGEVAHVCTRGRGCFESRDYRHVEVEVGAIDELRDTEKWRAWVETQAAAVTIEV